MTTVCRPQPRLRDADADELLLLLLVLVPLLPMLLRDRQPTCMMLMPINSCCKLHSSASTSARTEASTPSSSQVDRCSSRMALQA
jgi:hypothetical protein